MNVMSCDFKLFLWATIVTSGSVWFVGRLLKVTNAREREAWAKDFYQVESFMKANCLTKCSTRRFVMVFHRNPRVNCVVVMLCFKVRATLMTRLEYLKSAFGRIYSTYNSTIEAVDLMLLQNFEYA